MAPFLFKIKFGDILRRLNVNQKSSSSQPDLTFKDLELKIREMFGIDSSQDLRITYIDSDNDAIAMCEDQDLFDACVIQGLNTLRLEVKTLDRTTSSGPAMKQTLDPKLAGETFLRNVLPHLTPDGIHQLLKSYEPLIKSSAPCGLVSEALEGLIKSVTGAMSSGFPTCQPPTGTPTPASHDAKETANPPHDGTKTASDPDMCSRKRGAEHVFGRMFHKGVQCDECGMYPIVGPRFKSIKKEDYDLCYSCYLDTGNEADYQRIDRPLHTRRHPFHPPCGSRIGMVPPSPHAMPHMPMGAPPFSPFFHRGRYGWKNGFPGRARIPVNNNVFKEQTVGKLDARFVQDVTIFDGTELAPGTNFTKIWRLRNIGSIHWPKETQLVFVGGDVLGSNSPVNLELSEEGLPPDEEIEASADLVAPQLPGRYVSNWRLMAPSGQKFGHRVWVLIQVVPKDEQSPQVQESLLPVQQVREESIMVEFSGGDKEESNMKVTFNSPNLMDLETATAPPFEMVASEKTAIEEYKLEQKNQIDDPLGTVISEVGGFSIVEKPVETDLLSARQMNPVIMDYVDVSEQYQGENTQGENTEQPSYEAKLSENFSSDISNSLPGLSIVEEKQPPKHDEELDMSSVREGVQAIFEETLLEQLESMGFRQRILNAELLKKNKNNLQSTIEDLVAASEWEPIMLELDEMGFGDKELNLRLMFKNNGSVKRVVKELVQMQVLAGKASAGVTVKGKEKAL